MSALPIHLDSASFLSAKAIAVLSAGGPDAYSELVVRGGGSVEGRKLLSALSPADVLTRPAAQRDTGDALLAGLWLWHDWLDESHTLSQSLPSAGGSFWHAIMHRREGDFSNARYWYARCGGHPAHMRFLTSAEALLASPEYAGAAEQLRNGRDGYGLTEIVEEAVDRSADDALQALAVALQRLEWTALFEETLPSA